MLGSLILYLKGMRIMMFQLSGFYCRTFRMSDAIVLGIQNVCARPGKARELLPWRGTRLPVCMDVGCHRDPNN